MAISSIASWARWIVSKSHSGPSNRTPSRDGAGSVVSANGSLVGEELVEYREDLGGVRHLAHGEVRMTLRHRLVGLPQRGAHRGEADRRARFVADLDVGEVLHRRQNLLVEEAGAAAGIARQIVAVRGLGGVDVPGLQRVALADDPHHLLERGRDDRAAGLAAVEEGILVD